jgi:thiamine pyrophosphokinase
MENALILCNGSVIDHARLRSALMSHITQRTTIIAVDGGVVHALKMDIPVHVALGDFDSIKPEQMEYLVENQIKIISFPTDKDMTDSQLAVEYCIKQNFSAATITAFTGSRLDHSLGNMLLFARLDRKIPITLIDEHNEAFFCRDFIELQASIGTNVSIIPLFGDIVVKKTSGLHYQLADYRVPIGSSLCISNFAVDRKQNIELSEGEALITLSRD